MLYFCRAQKGVKYTRSNTRLCVLREISCLKNRAEEKRKGVYPMSANVSMKSLLESGVHFGHRTNKWNPLMKPYIFTERNGIHIIDLQQNR
jgi:hypothetical protein